MQTNQTILAALIADRRHLHQHAELGWCEFYTTAYLASQLAPLGGQLFFSQHVIAKSQVMGRDLSDVIAAKAQAKAWGAAKHWLDKIGDYPGLMVQFDGCSPGPVLALRFDMDAVAVSESQAAEHAPTAQLFASKNERAMHACGHDGHMAIGLGLARYIASLQRQFQGQIKLLFQPAEEGCRGAKAMAESGILDDVDYFLSGHLGLGLPSNAIAMTPTHLFATTKFDIQLFGQAAHAGASPELGHNALAAACQAVNQMMAIAPHGQGVTRLNIGTIKAGSGRNVIADYALLQGETRGETLALNQYMMQRVAQILSGIHLAYNVTTQLDIMGEASDVVQSEALAQQLSPFARQHFSQVLMAYPFGASEDVSHLMARVQQCGGQALYLLFGADLQAGHHQSRFDFDEGTLHQALSFYIDAIGQLLAIKN